MTVGKYPANNPVRMWPQTMLAKLKQTYYFTLFTVTNANRETDFNAFQTISSDPGAAWMTGLTWSYGTYREEHHHTVPPRFLEMLDMYRFWRILGVKAACTVRGSYSDSTSEDQPFVRPYIIITSDANARTLDDRKALDFRDIPRYYPFAKRGKVVTGMSNNVGFGSVQRLKQYCGWKTMFAWRKETTLPRYIDKTASDPVNRIPKADLMYIIFGMTQQNTHQNTQESQKRQVVTVVATVTWYAQFAGPYFTQDIQTGGTNALNDALPDNDHIDIPAAHVQS